ncbi:MAG: glucokinase, partial [Trueperaceae bacterium]|nr:glucokinase [Trueperaceae bacterium]
GDATGADAARAQAAGTLAVIAAGTGLGYAALVRDGDATVALASEGGHADFSPTDPDEIALQRALALQHGHVSVERVVSGPGLYQGYLHLLARDGGDRANELDVHLAGHGASAPADPSAEVARAALEGRSTLAERAVLRFLAAYGGEAGNWALRTLATGGVWLGGGVARKLLLGPPETSEAWRERARDAFLERFRAKGRLSPLLGTIPVRVITSDLAPLLGAAHCARTRHGR